MKYLKFAIISAYKNSKNTQEERSFLRVFACACITVNDMLGDLIKVTPSSKMVGDLAIFMVQNDLTPENIVARGESLTFPDSVVSYFKGMMGQPPCGFPEDIQNVVLKGEKPITCRPGELLEPVNFEQVRKEIEAFHPNPDMRDVISYCLYPKVLEDFWHYDREYGYLMHILISLNNAKSCIPCGMQLFALVRVQAV